MVSSHCVHFPATSEEDVQFSHPHRTDRRDHRNYRGLLRRPREGARTPGCGGYPNRVGEGITLVLLVIISQYSSIALEFGIHKLEGFRFLFSCW